MTHYAKPNETVLQSLRRAFHNGLRVVASVAGSERRIVANSQEALLLIHGTREPLRFFVEVPL